MDDQRLILGALAFATAASAIAAINAASGFNVVGIRPASMPLSRSQN